MQFPPIQLIVFVIQLFDLIDLVLDEEFIHSFIHFLDFLINSDSLVHSILIMLVTHVIEYAVALITIKYTSQLHLMFHMHLILDVIIIQVMQFVVMLFIGQEMIAML